MKGKFFIQTYGCQMNVHDTEYMCAILNKAGYAQAQTLKEADIILLNTCAVRQKAEDTQEDLSNLCSIKGIGINNAICLLILFKRYQVENR